MGDKTEPLLLLDFQATWCEPCKWSEPVMEQVLRHFGDRIVLEKSTLINSLKERVNFTC